MSTFFGIYDKNKNSIDDELLELVMEKLNHWNADKTSIWIKGHIGMGHHLLRYTNEKESEEQLLFHESTDCCISADLRIDYREELCDRLNIPKENRQTFSDTTLVLESYLKWGKDCVNKLYGDFAFAIWDGRTNTIFCARDHFGIRPFFYFNSPDYFIFSSELKGLLSCPIIQTEMNESWVADTLTSSYSDKHESPFRDIITLSPAHCMSISPDEDSTTKYWDLNENPRSDIKSEEKAVRVIQDSFYSAVKTRIRNSSTLGIELSGGLDSSAIAATATEVCNSSQIKLVALTHSAPTKVQNNSFKNKKGLIERVVSYLGIQEQALLTGESRGALNALIESLELNNSSTIGSYAMMSDILYEEAKRRGINLILSGFGGDEGVTMEAKVYLKELAKSWQLNSLMKELQITSKGKNHGVYRKVLSYIVQSHFPSLSSTSEAQSRRRSDRYSTFGIDSEFEKRLGIRKRYLEMDQTWKETSVSARQVERYSQNAFTGRLEESYLAAHAKRIEICYPFLDVKLVEIFHSLPSFLKYRKGVGRYLFRLAMTNKIPDEVCWLDDKASVAVPNVPFRFLLNRIEFEEIINEGRMNNTFHYVDYDKMLWMINQMDLLEQGKDVGFIPNTLFSHMEILILQRWQREGKIDIGIRC